MSEIDIIEKINNSAEILVESDVDTWIIPGLMDKYSSKIKYLSSKAYGIDKNNGTAILAFKEKSKIELKKALSTFLFKHQHWKVGRDINSYLIVVLNRLADTIYYDNNVIKKAQFPICPLCKLDNVKSFLVQEDKLWRCKQCTQEIDNLTEELKTCKIQIAQKQSLLRLCKIFALHSKKGYRCPDCSKFIPESYNTTFGISCPYDDCIFMGNVKDLEKIPHPSALSQRTMVSLQTNLTEGNDVELQDLFVAENITADCKIHIQEQNKKEYVVLSNVIEEQISTIKRTNPSGTIMQKLLMYEAFKEMLEKFPEEMISYLVHRKQSADFPIQARIFQQYASLIENYLPFSIEKKNEKIDIVSLLDPDLALFAGISIYEAIVNENNIIPNNTIETYIGGRKFKSYGPCFIGKIVSIINKDTNELLNNKIKEYSFVKIKMNESIIPGTNVVVKHYRIPSHYELAALVFLQRTRRQIVDSVYFRLNKKKRVAGV